MALARPAGTHSLPAPHNRPSAAGRSHCGHRRKPARLGPQPPTRQPSPCRATRVHVDKLKTETGDPQDQPRQRRLVWQLRAEGCRVPADGNLAIVEFRAQRAARLADESDFICLRTRQGFAPRVLLVQPAASMPDGRWRAITHPRVTCDLAAWPRIAPHSRCAMTCPSTPAPGCPSPIWIVLRGSAFSAGDLGLVTNQVITAPDSARPSQTHTDMGIALTCGDPTQRDAIG